jgi:Fur family ferric uptake transcriptional regulator
MKQLHQQEKKQFKKLFRQERIDRFDDRLKVLEVFLNTERHVTAAELLELLEKEKVRLEPAFVRDTLRMLCRFGFAAKNRFDNGQIRYEHHHLDQHHDHIVCTKCRRIVEFHDEKLEDLQVAIAESHGFHMLRHTMEIYGICTDCLKAHDQLTPLTAAKAGERVVIMELTGGSAARMRLLSMGLRIGDQVEIITNQGRGQMALAVDEKRLVLGRGLAQKIRVQLPGAARVPETGKPLSQLKAGQSAMVVRVGGNGVLRRRILEMGLLKGTRVKVEKYAPLKDPVELVVKGYHLSLRVEEAAQIIVEDVR